MKTIHLILAALALAFTGCATVTVRTVTTDKAGTVTETTTTTQATDPAALALAGAVVTAYAPRAMVIREEKCDHDMRRLLRGWQGRWDVAAAPPPPPIGKDEIAKRWKPLPP